MKKQAYFIGSIALILIFLGTGCTSGCETSNKKGISEYDGKLLDIAGENSKIKGSVQLKEKDGKLLAYYHFYINDELKDNNKCPTEPNQECGKDSYGYEYAATMDGKVSTDKKIYVNTLTNVYCNNGNLPVGELNRSRSDMYHYSTCHDDNNYGYKTKEFYLFLAPYYDSYEDFLSTNKFTLYGASDYWEKDKDEEEGYTLNQRKAVEEGKIYRTYKFRVTE